MYFAMETLTDSTTSIRNWSSINDVSPNPIVPISFLRNTPPSEIRIPYCPLEDNLIGIWKYGSIIRNPPVPQNMFLFSNLLINQTSAMKVVSPPLAKFTSFCNTGKLAEDKICLPEINESQRVPFLNKNAS